MAVSSSVQPTRKIDPNVATVTIYGRAYTLRQYWRLLNEVAYMGYACASWEAKRAADWTDANDGI